jgi:hypothetical protein
VTAGRRARLTSFPDAVIDGEPIQMFVMAADIRESTNLMKEAVRFERFALVMDKFVTSVRHGIRGSGGWFDKFTGDGFLAYWIVQTASAEEYEERFVQTTGDVAHTAHSWSTSSIGVSWRTSGATPGTCPPASVSRWAWTPDPATW